MDSKQVYKLLTVCIPIIFCQPTRTLLVVSEQTRLDDAVPNQNILVSTFRYRTSAQIRYSQSVLRQNKKIQAPCEEIVCPKKFENLHDIVRNTGVVQPHLKD